MAQGNAKVKKQEKSGGRKKGGVVKKGARAIAPKHAQKQREHKVQKVGEQLEACTVADQL